MFPDDATRLAVMKLYFEIYLDIFAKYGDLVTTSEDLQDIAYIYYEERFKKDLNYALSLVKAGIKGLGLLHYISIKTVWGMLQTICHTSSAWIYEVTDKAYIHLDLIAVKKECRGQGKAKHLMRYVILQAQKVGKPLTLETQSEENINMYKHMGFKVVKAFKYKDLTQYCMLFEQKTREGM